MVTASKSNSNRTPGPQFCLCSPLWSRHLSRHEFAVGVQGATETPYGGMDPAALNSLGRSFQGRRPDTEQPRPKAWVS